MRNPSYYTKRGPIAWMANNPVAANLLMLILLIGGILSYNIIKQEVFPDFELDMVSITVPYPSASPEEIEQGVILSVEEAVRGIEGVKKVESTAREGAGIVMAELLTGANRQKTYQEIKQEVDRITTFPENAEEPQVVLVSRKREVLTSVLYGNVSEKSLRELSEQIRDRLLQDPMITQVDLQGIRGLEISVSIPRDTLRAYELTLDEVAQQISAYALELPGGGVKTEGGEILIRVADRRDYGREFEDIPIVATASGTQIFLKDIAEISDGFEDTDYNSIYNGDPAIMLVAYRVGDETPLEVSQAVRKQMKALQPELPPGVHFSVMYDMSDIFRQRKELLLRNGLLGLGLVLVLLGVFLEIRLAFWVSMGIPVSFLGGLMFMPLMGLSINMISMFAFLIALGIVVDDAIVVGENIYDYHQRGFPPVKAAIAGVREVAVPVTFSVLTNVVTFLPMFFIPGFIGKIWKVIPSVVISVFLISLFECLFILPAHLGHSKPGGRTRIGSWVHTRQQQFSHAFSAFIQNRYGPFLVRVIQHRYLTVAVGLGILFVTMGYLISGRMGMEIMPKVESDFAVVTAVLPYGSPLSATENVRNLLLDAAAEINAEYDGKALAGVYAGIGGEHNGVGGSHVIQIYADLPELDHRPLGTRDLTDLWRKKVGSIPGLLTLQFTSDHGGPGSGASLTIELSHSDHTLLEKASADLAAELSRFPNVTDIDSGFSAGKPQLDFHVLPVGLKMGLTGRSIAMQVRNSFYGAEALRQQRGRNEVKVKVRLPEEERVSEHDITEFLVHTPTGQDIPLAEVAEIERGRAYTQINRRDGRRTVNVTADVIPQKDSDAVLNSVIADTIPILQERYPGLSYSLEGKQADMRDSMSVLYVGFALALLGIYAMLAIPFKSYIQPLIIMISIPFGVVGAVIGHLIMGYSLSLISMMGIVALAGVVVNDSLVFIDFANRKRREGLSVFDSVTEAGVRRFRPIMLTTLTTFCGLAPMIFETSMQARFMIPMAISLGYGILFATLITLVLVPSLYTIVDDVVRTSQRTRRFLAK